MISSHTCKRKCNDKISQDRREAIHTQFWELEEKERKVYVLGHINKSTVGRRTTEDKSRRGKKFTYNLRTADGKRKIVCKKIFLATLGYKKNYMFFLILKQAKEGISPKQDMRR